ncbi:MAG TPA: RNA 2',3'-cyclic phosphodiesterase [Polyangiaceae bacterium]|jgi:2'-5' RNA ligase
MTIARCFVALDLGEAALATAADAQELLDADVVRKSAAETMHLTIKFLGQVDVDAVARKVFEAVAPFGGPSMALGEGRIQGFPAIERARVVVLECAACDSRLAEMAARADDAAFALGVPREGRPFRPHVTLARSKKDFDARKIAARFGARPLGFATDLVLYESAGGKYKAL